MLIRYVEIGCCVAQRKSGETVAQVSCIRLPALRPHCLRQQKKDKTKNQNDLHTTFWIIFKRIKKNLVDHQVEKMKIETLNVVDKKQENFLQDMVQICDSMYRETVDASMHAAAQMVRSERREVLDLLRAMVQKKGSIEVEKLKMVEKEKKEKKERGKLSYI